MEMELLTITSKTANKGLFHDAKLVIFVNMSKKSAKKALFLHL